MPDPNTESRLISLEKSMDRLQDSLQQLVAVQQELKDVSIHIVELLGNNRFIGVRVEQLEKKLENTINCIQDLQVTQGKIDTQISGVWRIVALLSAIAMAIFGWALNKF